MQPTAEIALESRAQGAAFLSSTRAVWPAPMLADIEGRIVYPIAVAAACAAHGIDARDGLHAFFHAIAANLVSAGVRLIPLGQTDGQRVLAGLEPGVSAAVDQGLSLGIEDIGSAAPVIDLASMHHETQYTRLFRS
jgi:urease accessory protein